MANIINNNFHFFKLKPYRGEYWDITLNKDMNQYAQNDSNKPYNKNLISYFNFDNNLKINGNMIESLNDYTWNGAYSIGYSLDNIGYTCLDNGLIYFERDKIRNEEFIPIYTESKLEINQDVNLKMHFVTGSTIRYSYDYSVENDFLKLNGGFLQGFFKTECGKYETLPSIFNHDDEISFEVVLKPSNFINESRFKTLNEIYPSNKGMFLYIGTRAENKWIYLYDKKKDALSYDDYIEDAEIDVDKFKITSFTDMSIEFEPTPKKKQTRGIVVTNPNVMDNYIDFGDEIIFEEIKGEKCDQCDMFGDDFLNFENECDCEFDYIENELDISDFIFQTNDGSLTLGKNEEYEDYNNPFLLYNRTCDGFHVGTWEKDSFVRYVGLKTKKRKENLFLLMNRTCSGYTIPNYLSELQNDEVEEYDIYADLYENALGFRITDEGEIGYRYLIKNCEKPKKLEVVEAYSKKNIVKKDEWNHILIKVIFVYDKMFFKFYLNGNLVFISKFLPKLNLRQLNETYEKQETVPFNISLGGGTQGLAETILPNYMLTPYNTYPLEKNFAGTFIGYIKSLKIYFGEITYNEIFNNFQYENEKILK